MRHASWELYPALGSEPARESPRLLGDESAARARRHVVPADTAAERVVSAALGGDANAWALLSDRFRPAVLRVARSYRLDSHVAEDVAQEVFLSFFRHLDALRDPNAVGAWFMTSARRTALRQLALQRRELAAGLVPATADSQIESFADELIDALTLEDALRSLPDDQGEILEGILAARTERELVEELEIPRTSLYRRFNRAARTVYEALAPDDAARRWRDRDVLADEALLFGRVVAVEEQHFSVLAGEQPDGVQLMVHLPWLAVAPPERARVREGSLLRWSLERWRDPDGGLLARSVIQLEPEGEFSPQQRDRIAGRASEIAAQLAGFRAPVDV